MVPVGAAVSQQVNMCGSYPVARRPVARDRAAIRPRSRHPDPVLWDREQQVQVRKLLRSELGTRFCKDPIRATHAKLMRRDGARRCRRAAGNIA